jgi:hypothetical protein
VRRSILAVLLILFCSSLPAAAGATRLETAIPGETDVVLMVDDLPRFLARWPASPLGRAWNDPQVKRFLAPMREEMEIDRWHEEVLGATGIELDEILAGFTGQVALLLPDFESAMNSEEQGGGLAQVAMLAHVADGDLVPRLMKLDLEDTRKGLSEDQKIEEIEEEFLGETLHVRRTITADGEQEGDGWAIVDGVAIVAEPKSYLQSLVGALKGKSSATPLAESPGFTKMRGKVQVQDLLVHMDSSAFVPAIEEAIRTSLDNPEEPNPMGLQSGPVISALALDTIESIFLSTTLLDRATHVDMGLLYGADRGVVKLLAIDPGPVKMPAFLPNDAVEASVGHFSFPRMWATLKEMLVAMNPALSGMMEAQLAQLSTTYGVDVEKGIFGSMGNEIFTAKYLRPSEEPGQAPSFGAVDELTGIAITDRQSMEIALEALKSMIGIFSGGVEMFDSTDYLGHTIFTIKEPIPSDVPGGEPSLWSYALTESHAMFCVGTLEPLKAAVSGQGKRDRQIWNRPEVKRAVKALPAGASGLSFYDTETLLRTAIDGCGSLEWLMDESEESAEADEGEPLEPEICDPDAKPDPSTISRYFGPAVGAQYKDGGAIRGTVRMLHPER